MYKTKERTESKLRSIRDKEILKSFDDTIAMK